MPSFARLVARDTILTPPKVFYSNTTSESDALAGCNLIEKFASIMVLP
jgi:hypothetical protein